MTAYYNEIDPFAAAWLRELIADNLIAPGEVDERSIEDVTPDDLRPFQQCHFFAGIGVWSLAARRAGIPDDAPLWSGSCPCQPFSAAGKGGGFDDVRHLWPSFHYLIEQCRPALVVGEQVAGADGDTWFDLVSADLDATAYAFGVAETVACGFGAPHKRSRNYWMAYRIGARLEGYAGHGGDGHEPRWLGSQPPRSVAPRGVPDRLADAESGEQRRLRERGASVRREELPDRGYGAAEQLADPVDDGQRQHGHGLDRTAGAVEGHAGQRERVRTDPADGGAAEQLADANGERGNGGSTAGGPEAGAGTGDARNDTDGGVADTDGAGRAAGTGRGLYDDQHHAQPRDQPLRLADANGRDGGDGDVQRGGQHGLVSADGSPLRRKGGWPQVDAARELERPGPTNGLWADPDWLLCRDEKWRPVEPGTFPLADAGAFRNRVGLLRGAGNAITLGQAEGFLRAVIASIR